MEDPMAIKISKLNQLLQGRAFGQTEHSMLLSRDGLLDTLLALYEECTHASLLKNQYVANFVKKYAKTIDDVKRLRICIKDFEVKSVIGRGHFGEVKVVREKQSGDVYALKVLRKDDTLAQQNVAFYEEEKDIMARTQSVWHTHLQYAFQDAHSLYLVMEFHPGGDLLSLLARYDDVFEEQMARFYLGEMLLAVHALHTMGYVHRDVKPENILIDRTGHIKLADFGSACKLNDDNSTCSNMPVGTPDYISPEVLVRMNSDHKNGKFSVECDWWSLGVCAYEMMYGAAPFTAESGAITATYANIMNFKERLKLPTDMEVSKEAEDLIKNLLTDSQSRLSYDRLCVHPFFATLDLNNIRSSRPPFIPMVTSNDDVSNFEEFPASKARLHFEDSSNQGFTGKHLPFIGFTFTKGLPERCASTSDAVSSPACKNSLERRLAAKSAELQDLRQKCKSLEDREANIQGQLRSVETKLLNRDNDVQRLETERDALERSMAHYVTETKSLQRMLEYEKEQRVNDEKKALEIHEQIRAKKEQLVRIQHEEVLEEMNKVLVDVELEKEALMKKISQMEKQLKQERMRREQTETKVSGLQTRLSQAKESSRSAEVASTELVALREQLEARERSWKSRLEQCEKEQREMLAMVSDLRECKNQLESEVLELRMGRQAEGAIRKQLFASEERRKSLEDELQRLTLMERREENMRAQLEEKSRMYRALTATVGELEDRLESREIEYKKCERIYAQREEQHLAMIADLEAELASSRNERNVFEESSILAYEEAEEKLRVIHDQECTIVQLKGSVNVLEEQVQLLRGKCERSLHTPRSKHSPSKSRPRVNSPSASRGRLVSGHAQTDDILNQSGCTQTQGCYESVAGSCQTDEFDFDNAVTQTSFVSTRVRSKSPKRVSFSCQTAGTNTSVRECSQSPGRQRRSNLTQTTPVRASLEVQASDDKTQACRDGLTSVSVKVKVRQRSRELGQGDKTHDSLNSSDDTSAMTSSPESSMTSCDLSDDRPKVIGKVSTAFWECQGKKRKSPVKTKPVALSSKSVQITEPKAPPVEKSVHCTQTEVAEVGGSVKEKARQLEEVTNMRQDKVYLEYKVDSLQDELSKVKVNKDEQRIRALDLKHELSERTRHYENKLDELRQELTKAKMAASEALANQSSQHEREAGLKARLEKVQQELDQLKIDSRVRTTQLQDERDDLASSEQLLRSQVKRLEENEQLLKQALDETETDLREITEKYIKLAPKSKDFESDARLLQEQKTRLQMTNDRLCNELNDVTRQRDQLQEQVKKLRDVCSELETQVTDYEALNRAYEKREGSLTNDKSNIEKAVEEKEQELNAVRNQLEREKAVRLKAEEKRDELNKLLSGASATIDAESERARQANIDSQTRIDVLNHQLTQGERERALVDCDNKNLKRRLEAVTQDAVRLKEEMSALITRATELKSSNLRLSKNLEAAMDRYELLSSQNADLQNTIDSLLATHDQERFKLNATMSQQTKLIDYLQTKVENPPRKKKGIFAYSAGRREDQSGTLPPASSLQVRELQAALASERERCRQLQAEVIRLKDLLHQKHTEDPSSSQGVRGRRFVNEGGTPLSSASATPRHLQEERDAILENLMLSPHNSKPGSDGYPGGSMSVPKARRRVKKNAPQTVIRQHSFTTGLNSKATNCAVCLGSVLFVKQAAKCDHCKIVVHPKCVCHVFTPCGSVTDYIRHYGDTLRQARATPTMRLSVADLMLYMSAAMKVPRPGKQMWERRFVVLKENTIQIYEKETSGLPTPLETFQLCPQDGTVSVHSAVTAAELTNTSATDLPYIFRLEYTPYDPSNASRSLYLMALSFPEKQRWVAVLEAIVNYRGMEDRFSNAKVLGNMILSLSKRRLEINCTLPLKHHDVLVGSDDGLYLLELNRTADSRSFIKIEGFGAVAMMSHIPILGKVVLVTGKSRDLAYFNVSEFEANRHQNPPSVTAHPLAKITTVTTFTWTEVNDVIHLCAATADELALCLCTYSREQDRFSLVKDTASSEPCSCMYMGKHSIIFGSDKFYSVDYQTFNIKELLDRSDTSLAFAVFGAAHYDSFPIEILRISASKEPPEFLLCFHEFGVFVDAQGRRTRDQDMKWSGPPLMFAFRKPYLYIVHFNTLQIVEILPRNSGNAEGQHAMLNLPGPRYLGSAIPPGAVYIASLHESATEIICFRGNMADPRDHNNDEDIIAMKENIPLSLRPQLSPKTSLSEKRHSRIKTPLASLDSNLNSADTSDEFVSPPPPPLPPKHFHTAEHPTTTRQRRHSDVSTTSEDSTTSSCSSASTVSSLRQNFEQQKSPSGRSGPESDRTGGSGGPGGRLDRLAGGGAGYSSGGDEPCHKTIKTLKQVLAEQSRQRRGYGNPQHNA